MAVVEGVVVVDVVVVFPLVCKRPKEKKICNFQIKKKVLQHPLYRAIYN